MQQEQEEYRSQALICQRLAERAATPGLKAAWLRLAQNWLKLRPAEACPTVIPFDGMQREDPNPEVA